MIMEEKGEKSRGLNRSFDRASESYSSLFFLSFFLFNPFATVGRIIKWTTGVKLVSRYKLRIEITIQGLAVDRSR